ncbi:MAG: alpha/beta fold hydrolase [Gammaproteobacteria bacterium]
MAYIEISKTDGLCYEHDTLESEAGVTFVMFNALSADYSMWRATVGDALAGAGHGLLLWNYRGQEGSPAAPDIALDAALITGDSLRVLNEAQPARPVFVGLSIGGLFAMRALLEGASASGLVLVNTLRRPGPRLAWVNDAVVRCAQVGGLDLMRDLYAPMIFNEEWLGQNRAEALLDTHYSPLADDFGPLRMLRDCRSADWNVPYERIEPPVLVVSGLQDQMFLDLADVQKFVARIPRCERVDVPDAGHMVPLERPAAFADALLKFADKL